MRKLFVELNWPTVRCERQLFCSRHISVLCKQKNINNAVNTTTTLVFIERTNASILTLRLVLNYDLYDYEYYNDY